ncbi:FtsK/SpoIIIE domain-containing protein [Rothia sp. HMSC064D08]|uniref:FtsK/SpoIIIE domain-containing protein n=1 Tax=Rothia sp. HMSC064D08 TaxID=1715104 RepID=UPI001FEF98E1|nr:FtsK/SpoIIIE domain-containing protein [Rothia sp. HMSC064D08]
MVGTSLCVICPPGKAPELPTPSHDSSPFTPVIVNPPAPRKLGMMLMTILLPLVAGVAFALFTGMWIFLLMSVASSLFMLMHFFGGRAENRGAAALVKSSAKQELERAQALPTAGTLLHAAAPDAARSPAVVLGYGPRLPYISGRNVRFEKISPHPQAPHYIPVPVPGLPHDVSLRAEHLHAYLVQLVAHARDTITVITDAEHAKTPLYGALRSLGVCPRVFLHEGASQAHHILEKICDAAERSETALSTSQEAGDDQLFIISASLVRSIPAALIKRAAQGARLCIVHMPVARGTVDSPRSASVFTHIPHLQVHTHGDYLESVQYLLRGSITDDTAHKITGSSQHAGLTPHEGIVQNHPLDLHDICATADGLSTDTYIRTLGALSAVQASSPAGSGHGTGSVHARTLAFSELTQQSTNLLYEQCLQRWEHNRYAEDIRCLLGATTEGFCDIGFTTYGPHWLLGGTTGAGKSQLLRSLILSAALRYSPERLGLILVDFKGSAGLGPLVELPHTLSLLSDFDVAAVRRALEFLRADVNRRELDLRNLGVNSYHDYLRLCASTGEIPQYPEVVIVVDEFRMLVESMPDAMTELMRIATIGRSLGIHLLLATQRPQGSISQDIRANIATNICLRVASAQDSYNLLGHEKAAHISASSPGAGYVSLPDGRILAFRAPLVDALPQQHADFQQIYRWETPGWVPLNEIPSVQQVSTEGEDTLLTRAVHSIRDLYLSSHKSPAFVDQSEQNPSSVAYARARYTPIPQALPENFPLTRTLDTGLHQILGSDGARGHGYLLGAIEIPQYGKRQPIRLNLEAHPGALAVLGTVPERTAIINALIAQAIARQNPVYVLTSDAGYHRRLYSYADSLAVLVGPHEPQHLRFCLEKIRSSHHADQSTQQPLLICDGVDGWLEMLMRDPQTESYLYDVLAQSHREGYQVVFTSALPLRGRFNSVAYSTLLSRRFVESDLLRKSSKSYPLPNATHFAIEGGLNTALVGDVPLEASTLCPVVTSCENIIELQSGNSDFSCDKSLSLRQFPQTFPMPQLETIIMWHRGYNAQGTHILCGYSRTGTPSFLQAKEGVFIPVVGSRASGKTHFLSALRMLNPHLGALYINGNTPPDAQKIRQMCESVQDPEKTLILIDDLAYIPAATQQVLLELGPRFRAVWVAYTPWARWHSSPILTALSGCSRAVLLAPTSISDGDICSLHEIPRDMYTEGMLPAGRGVLVDAGRVQAFQVPDEVYQSAHDAIQAYQE